MKGLDTLDAFRTKTTFSAISCLHLTIIFLCHHMTIPQLYVHMYLISSSWNHSNHRGIDRTISHYFILISSFISDSLKLSSKFDSQLVKIQPMGGVVSYSPYHFILNLLKILILSFPV